MKEKQKKLRNAVREFARPKLNTSVIQLFNTLVPFFLLWFLAYKSLSISIWLSLLFSVTAAFFVIRTFIIFHDCTHYSFFRNNRANRIVGTLTGIITLFPYTKWQRNHSIHHATSSNLDKLGVGDIWIMTVDEYLEASPSTRLQYRLYRNPFVLFILGPFLLYFVTNRINRKNAPWKERLNTYIINIGILGTYGGLIYLIGWQSFILVQLPIVFIAGTLGIWLFYVQHQFEDSYFENEDKWNFVKAAVDGSSYYKLPKFLQWLTGNIGYHHVHHLSPRIPNYHLEKAHEKTPPLSQVTTITLKSSLQALNFRLYDEENRRFISFKEVKHLVT